MSARQEVGRLLNLTRKSPGVRIEELDMVRQSSSTDGGSEINLDIRVLKPFTSLDIQKLLGHQAGEKDE